MGTKSEHRGVGGASKEELRATLYVERGNCRVRTIENY